MYTNALVALVVSSLAGQALAAGAHHAHQQLHIKRDLVTEVVTVTDWVTVYATGRRHKQHYAPTRRITSTTTSVPSSAAPPPPPPPPPAAVPTTMATLPKPAPTEEPVPAPESVAAPAPPPPPPAPPAPAPAPTKAAPPPPPSPPPPPPPPAPTQPAPAPPAPPAPVTPPPQTGGGAGKPQRGLPYNHPELLPSLLGQGSKVTWTYNWGQYDDSKTDLEFVPMCWSDGKGFPATWKQNAQKAIDSGSKHLLSFNEPDLDSQANMSPSHAAQAHIDLMNPFRGKARIGSPAITNSGSPNMGISWMKQFFAACAGNCAVDFVVAHAYGLTAEQFLQHLVNVHDAFNMPVWVTEFGFNGSEEEQNKMLATTIKELETNPKYSFVERYAYFMVSEGNMINGGRPSKFGNTFAYASF
ncbi:Glycosyl hydrolase catalytic core domain containing protein [Rhypophila sp. PSN 637]